MWLQRYKGSRKFVRQCTTKPPKQIPMYDFNRFNNAYNYGKPLRWPNDLLVTPFIRQEWDESDQDAFDHQMKQTKVPLAELEHLLPQDAFTRYEGDIKPFDATFHSDTLFLAFSNNPRTSTLERYILKFFPSSGASNARREVLLSYIYTEVGERIHVPKIAAKRIFDRTYVIRRFYKGQDGRFLLAGSNPNLPEMASDDLVKNYALRYVLCGDSDFHNPGNVIFTRHSRLTSQPEIILQIDGEFIIPDESSMRNFYGDKTWKQGDPIPGSTAWRRTCSEELGPDVFFEKMVSSENPMLAFLRRKHKMQELKELTLSPFVLYNCLGATPYIEQLVRSFDILPLETLQEDKADFQIILNCWRREYELGNPVTLFKLITGLYTDKK